MTLQNVQPGDTLIRIGFMGLTRAEAVTVERVTKTQIIINGVRFRKRDGCEIGAGVWHRFHLRWPHDNEIEELGLQRQRNNLVYEIGRACERNKLRLFPLETLQRINAILEEENGTS